MASGKTILWFRADLRLHDNELLQCAGCASIVPVFCFDPRQFGFSSWKTLRAVSSRKTGVFKAKFLLATVAELKEKLRGIGSDLLVFFAKPEDVIPALA